MNSPTCSIGLFGLALLRENAYIPAMSPKKIAKPAMKKAKLKKAKDMKKPAAASGPHTMGRSEFSGTVCDKAKKNPLGELFGSTMGDLAHAGAPAWESLQDVWSKALLDTYKEHNKDAVSAWTSRDCLRGKSNCLHLEKHLHVAYDQNNQPNDDATSMVAFLPVMEFPEVFPKPVANEEPYDAYVLCRGVDATEAVQSFVSSAGVEYDLKVKDGMCSIGEFITITQAYPTELEQAAEDLKKVESNYDEASQLRLVGRNGFPKDATYSCITKNDIKDEVKKLANMRNVKVSLHGRPDWCVNGTEKYIKVSVKGTVHWFSLRMRACRILRHRHLGGLPNGGEDCESESQDLSESEVENLRQAPLAWTLSSKCLKAGSWPASCFTQSNGVRKKEYRTSAWFDAVMVRI